MLLLWHEDVSMMCSKLPQGCGTDVPAWPLRQCQRDAVVLLSVRCERCSLLTSSRRKCGCWRPSRAGRVDLGTRPGDVHGVMMNMRWLAAFSAITL